MYLRKSREDIEAEREGRFETLAKHELQLTQLADRLGLSLAREPYRELASGDTLDEREACKAMLREVMTGDFDGVLVFDLQRLTRGDMIDQGTILRAFMYTGTLIVTPSKVYNPRDTLDSDYMEMDMLFGRRELNRIKQRMVTGKENAVRQGQYIGPYAPFGWDKASQGRMKTLVPNGDNETMTNWYRLIADGLATPGSIARDMNARGIPSPTGKRWNPGSVTCIIRNPINKGYVRWNAKKTTKVFEDGDVARRRVTTADGPIIAKALWNGAVSEEVWDAANAAIDARVTPRMRASLSLVNPLAGILVCARCGTSIQMKQWFHDGNRTHGYGHSYYNHDDCWMVGAEASVVIGMTVDALAEEVVNLQASCKAGDDGRGIIAAGRIRELEKQIESEAGTQANLLRLAEKGLITDEEFAERRVLAAERACTAEEELASLQALLDEPRRIEERVIGLREAVEMLRDYHGRESEVNRALKAVIRRIEYTRERKLGPISLEIVLR